MKIRPSLRNYKHMVRMVKTEDPRTPYQLGDTYGNQEMPADSTARRQRVLDQWGIEHQSPRRPESPSLNGILEPRAQRCLFHSLAQNEQDLLTRRAQSTILTRHEAGPGTKKRFWLDDKDDSLSIRSRSTFDRAHKPK